MAEVRVGDVVVQTPQFDSLIAQRTLEQNAFYNSGIIRTDPVLDAHVSSGLGNVITMPFYNALDTTVEPNISNDDPNDIVQPQNIDQSSQMARKIAVNQHWKSMDFVPTMNAQSDPIDVITSQIGDYWNNVLSRYLISMCVGVYEDNAANDNGDMIYDGTGVGTGEIQPTFIPRTRQTKGDRKRDFTSLAVHSEVYENMEEQELISFVRFSGQNTLFPMYNGLFIVEADEMPKVGANFLSVMFGPGAFLFGNGAPKRPSSNSVEELVGGGAGAELVQSRREFGLHPDGWNFTGTPTGASATRAELEPATAWDRVFDRKRVNMAFLLTTG